MLCMLTMYCYAVWCSRHDRENLDGLRKLYAYRTEFFYYPLLKVELLWKQIVYSNAHLNPFNGIFSTPPLIIAEIEDIQFAEILNSQETCLWCRCQKIADTVHSILLVIVMYI